MQEFYLNSRVFFQNKPNHCLYRVLELCDILSTGHFLFIPSGNKIIADFSNRAHIALMCTWNRQNKISNHKHLLYPQTLTAAFCVTLTPVRSGAFKGHVWRGLVQQPFSGECGRHPHPGWLAQCRAAQSTSHRFYQQASIAWKKKKKTPVINSCCHFCLPALNAYLFISLP